MMSPKVEIGNVQAIQGDSLLGLPGVKYDVSVKGVKPKLIRGHIEILFPRNTPMEQIKAKLNMAVEFTNQWVFSNLPGVYFSLPDHLLQVLKDKPLGYKVWVTIYYEPGKGIRPLGLTVHMVNTNTKNLIWLYIAEDYGVKHSRTNVRVELSKSFPRYGVNGEVYMHLLLSVINNTRKIHKSFQKIVESKVLDTETLHKLGITRAWMPYLERKVYKEGGFTQFVKYLAYQTYKSMIEYGYNKKHYLVARDNVALGFLPNGDLVISGAEGMIKDVSIIDYGSGLTPSLSVIPPVTGYNWVKLFIANAQRSWNTPI